MIKIGVPNDDNAMVNRLVRAKRNTILLALLRAHAAGR